MQKFKDFIVWQKGRELVKIVYQLTSILLDEEKFGLISQINRAVVSIPANIAGGSGRKTNIDVCRFLDIAKGNSFLSEKDSTQAIEMNQEIRKMIYSLKQKLSR